MMNGIGQIYKKETPDGMKWLVHEEFLSSFPVKMPEKQNVDVNDPRYVRLRKKGRNFIVVKNGWVGHGDIIVKQYKPRAFGEYIKYLFKKSRAEAEWRMNHIFHEHNLSAPMPLAWGEKRVFGFWLKSALVFQVVSPCKTFFKYLSEVFHGKGDGDNKAVCALIDKLAEYTARMHGNGFHHGDMHGDNVLLKIGGGSVPEVYFIDLHEVRRVNPIPRRMRIDDLGRLNSYVYAKAGNRVRFLKKYLKEQNISANEWKTWARDIDRRTKAIWARYYRKRGTRIDKYGAFASLPAGGA